MNKNQAEQSNALKNYLKLQLIVPTHSLSEK